MALPVLQRLNDYCYIIYSNLHTEVWLKPIVETMLAQGDTRSFEESNFCFWMRQPTCQVQMSLSWLVYNIMIFPWCGCPNIFSIPIIGWLWHLYNPSVRPLHNTNTWPHKNSQCDLSTFVKVPDRGDHLRWSPLSGTSRYIWLIPSAGTPTPQMLSRKPTSVAPGKGRKQFYPWPGSMVESVTID